MEVFSSQESRVQGPTWRPGPGTPLAELATEYRRRRRPSSDELRDLRTLEMLLHRFLKRPALWGDLDDRDRLTAFSQWLIDTGRAGIAQHYRAVVVHRLRLFAAQADRQGGARCSY